MMNIDNLMKILVDFDELYSKIKDKGDEKLTEYEVVFLRQYLILFRKQLNDTEKAMIDVFRDEDVLLKKKLIQFN